MASCLLTNPYSVLRIRNERVGRPNIGAGRWRCRTEGVAQCCLHRNPDSGGKNLQLLDPKEHSMLESDTRSRVVILTYIGTKHDIFPAVDVLKVHPPLFPVSGRYRLLPPPRRCPRTYLRHILRHRLARRREAQRLDTVVKTRMMYMRHRGYKRGEGPWP